VLPFGCRWVILVPTETQNSKHTATSPQQQQQQHNSNTTATETQTETGNAASEIKSEVNCIFMNLSIVYTFMHSAFGAIVAVAFTEFPKLLFARFFDDCCCCVSVLLLLHSNDFVYFFRSKRFCHLAYSYWNFPMFASAKIYIFNKLEKFVNSFLSIGIRQWMNKKMPGKLYIF